VLFLVVVKVMTMAKKRVGLSKTVRFEVFKRDAFKCQYCGACAPEVVLEVDHIDPVSKGGDNDLMNLITACKPCNRGKRDRELSDDSSIQKQRVMLEELNERREQLEMLLAWREGMKDIVGHALQAAKAEWSSVVSGFYLNENGEQSLKKLLRTFPLSKLLDAMHIAANQYLVFDDKGKPIAESVNHAWSKVGGIARMSNMDETQRELYYIRGICRKRFPYCDEGHCLSLLRDAAELGIETQELSEMARWARSWNQWLFTMNATIKRVGG